MSIKKRIASIAMAFMMVVSVIPVGLGQADTAEAASYKKLQITYFSVGAGDSIHIKLPNGKNVLIDGGLTSQGSRVVAKLKKQKVKTIDYLISTHPDADHVGGLQQVFKSLKVKNFYYPSDVPYSTHTAKNVIRLAKREKCKIYHPKQDKVIAGGNGCKLEFVQANKNCSGSNEDSLAMFLDYGNLEALFCGDNEKGSQEAIEKHNVDIVMLPHHGSKYATTSTFIKRFDPEYVVVSTDGKKYGHPHKEVFNRLKAYSKGIKAYRTDKDGDIVVTATGKSWKINKKGNNISKYCGAVSSSSGSHHNSHSNSHSSAHSSTSAKGYVYITATGKKYHCNKGCRGLARAKKIYKVKKGSSSTKGLSPCSICY